jgi:predicted acetyltransferase
MNRVVSDDTMVLIQPDSTCLTEYIAALQDGWSPSEMLPALATQQLEKIAKDPGGFLHSLDDPALIGTPFPLPDGSTVPRLPGFWRWLWDGEFCGSVQLRWQPGTSSLPPYCMGHIGYSVVPWKRRRGYATRALGLLLPAARAQGLDYVELSTDPDNIASRKVILANGGELVERFIRPKSFGGGEARFRIMLAAG